MDQDVFDLPYSKDPSALDPIRALGAEVVSYPEQPIPSQEEIYERVSDADVIVLGIFPVADWVIEKLDRTKTIVFLGVGQQTFLNEALCERKGIKVFNTPNYGSNTVAEYAIGLVFALVRNICVADRRMRARHWEQYGLAGTEISSLLFGVVGTGAIGGLVARKALALGARVVAFDLYPNEELAAAGVRYVPIEELFATSDVVSLHLNVNDSTRGFVTRELIESMKKDAYFVNTARAAIVESYEPVYRRLRERTLLGAAIDVFEPEPIDDFDVCELENVITSPHIAYMTDTAMINTVRIASDRIAREYGEK